jgi:hypothetical protein
MQALLRSAFLGVALLALAGCSTSMAADSFGDDGVPTGGTGGSGGATLSLTFSDVGELVVVDPGEVKTLTVVVSPAEPAQTVRFALIDGPGSVEDAALEPNQNEVTTDAEGRASVTLTAPTVPTSFDVRARVGTIQTTLTIEVSAMGAEMLVVEPSYAGERQVTEWVAEVYDDEETTCAALDGNEEMVPVRSVTVPYGDRIEIADAPVGKKLAVTLRAGYFLSGCSDVEAIVEGQPSNVLVTVTNRPIQFEQSSVRLELGLLDMEAELDLAMQPVIDAVRDAVLGTASSDTEALLDAMQEEASESAVCGNNGFTSARNTYAWDSELTAAFGAQSATRFRDDLGGWLAAGVSSLATDDTFVGTLSAEPGVVGQANLVLSSVAGFRPGDAGFDRSVSATWTADASDNVVVGTTLRFNPSALLVLAALAPARMDEPGATSLAGALSLRAGRCDTIATTLTARGQVPGQSCAACALDCTRELCEGGIARLVARASAALDADADRASLRIAATGLAVVGEQAELTSLDGSWLGALDAADHTSELGGELSAVGAYPAP